MSKPTALDCPEKANADRRILNGRRPAATAGADILIVDDDLIFCELLQIYLREAGYRPRTAHGGKEALAHLADCKPDLILMDHLMPGLTGIDVVQKVKRDIETLHIPVIMISCETDRETRLRSLYEGAEDFLSKPIDRSELLFRVRNLLRLTLGQNVLRDDNLALTKEVRQRCLETVTALQRASSHRDGGTGTHISRISHYTELISTQMGLDEEFKARLYHTSSLHDIGKIAIPDSILLKSGPLSANEWDTMRTHTVLGERILRGYRTPFLEMGAEIALGHHERWDGSGYPDGLVGDAIPLSARITQICDVYDALRSARPYKSPYEHCRATDVITQGDSRVSPEHFDPEVLRAFTAINDRFAKIYQRQYSN
ncbi:MAG: response regulator [Gammaproteobacteria bacterium]|nr:response regulator [Gammaproteobacteria bacterium]